MDCFVTLAIWNEGLDGECSSFLSSTSQTPSIKNKRRNDVLIKEKRGRRRED